MEHPMGRLGRWRGFVPIAAMALIVAVARPALSGERTTLLVGNHPDQASEIAGATSASPSKTLAMQFVMALRNRGELERLIAAQQDPSSPEYRRWLTPDEFTSRFGPTAAGLARVSGWLKQKGFTVTGVDAATRELSFTGNVALAESVFGVKITASADGRWYSNLSDPALPADLAPKIESIHGLDNLLHSQAQVRRVSKRSSVASSPNSIVNGMGPAFGPPDIYTFYDETPLLNESIDGGGPGCIGVIEDSNIDQSAAAAFNTQFGLPALSASNFSVVLADSQDPGQTQDENETMVDVIYSHAIAPGSSITIYLGDQNHTKSLAVLDAMHAAITDKSSPCTAISMSFSICGGSKSFYKTQNSFFAQAASQGQSVIIASGDNGAAGLKLGPNNGCVAGTSRNVNELSASQYVTSIGGTGFTPDYSGGVDVGFVAESVWNDSIGASGGGESKFFSKPSFQHGLLPKDKNRDVPDISFAASPETPGFFYGGENGGPTVLCCIGGTSLGAPAWAGISRLISQASGTPPGNLNARIYQLGAMADTATTGIRDVTSGDNSFDGVTGFTAGPGYNKATGWGTVDMGVFVPAYVGP
jgi:subtilase family serine protease